MSSNLEYKEARHRELLERFVAAHEGFVLTLPAADPDEEVAMGTLRWDSGEALVYFETILSHVSLWSADREALEELRALFVPVAASM